MKFFSKHKKFMLVIAWLFPLSMIGGAIGYGIQFFTLIFKKNSRGISPTGFSVLVAMQIIILLHGWINLGERSYLIMAANIFFCVGIVILSIVY